MSRKCVVTGHDARGNARVDYAGAVPNDQPFQHSPGFGAALYWKTTPATVLGGAAGDPLAGGGSVLPAAGGSCAMLVTFPPESGVQPDAAALQAAAAEMAERLPGLADQFEPDHPGFHRTDTVDYGVLLEGELELQLDEGETVTFKAGDLVVQNGTRHAWRNPGQVPARMLFVMVGAQRAPAAGQA